jgi:hypothetical protein
MRVNKVSVESSHKDRMGEIAQYYMTRSDPIVLANSSPIVLATRASALRSDGVTS